MTNGNALLDPAAEMSMLSDDLSRAVRLCARPGGVLSAFATLAASFGFDGMSYLLLVGGMGSPRLAEHWTTAGTHWGTRYSTAGYHLFDPRVTGTRGRLVPIAWDSANEREDRQVRVFLDDACRYGIRSGIALSFDDARYGRVIVGWDSASSLVDPDREAFIRTSLGSLALLAAFIHESMVLQCQPTLHCRPTTDLTGRERECMALAARGMTSGDISVKLGITERTANFHFGNIIAKLGALNRTEAIARAVALHLV